MEIRNNPITLSPNSLDLFLECPLCFWLEKNTGIKRPIQYSYVLNASLDELLKEEFDSFRQKEMLPPWVENKNIKAKLFDNQKVINRWRDVKEGITYQDKSLKLSFFGVLDDVLELDDGSFAPLDYKSTGENISKIYDRFQLQLDSYTFLLEKNGYKTKRKAYIAFYVIDRSRGFIDRLPFQKKIVEVKTNPNDILDILKEAVEVARKEIPKEHSQDCIFGKWITKTKYGKI